MKQRNIGFSGIGASVVGLGTFAIGGTGWGGTDKKNAIRAIHQSIDEGINFIDTAPIYGIGLAEEIIGESIKNKRDKIVIGTKCGQVWHTKKGRHVFDWEDKSVYIYLGPESIKLEIEKSLKRLRTDYIDIYQIHWPDPTTPVEETMGALLELKEAGKIRAIGVSNMSSELLKEYKCLGAIDSDQEKYNMLSSGIESERLIYCKDTNTAFLAYSPLAQGLLSGTVDSSRKFLANDYRSKDAIFSLENRKKIMNFLMRINNIAINHNASIAQLVIAWTIAQEGVTHVLVGARNPNQAKENAGGGKINLSDEEIKIINKEIKQEPK